jgi:LmbE family N-acetylglucosaminyl deacetylase
MFTALGAPSRPTIEGPVALAVAHPDDETIGCGAVLPRIDGLVLVMVTDGAPATVPAGTTRDAYRATRAAELDAALAAGGVMAEVVRLGIADQEVIFRVREVAEAIAAILARVSPRAVFTHAYEGGHPDHDAVALAVQLAGAEDVVEMPFYHREGEGMVTGRFLPGAPETVVRLTDAESRLKRAMLDAHRSQAEMLSRFGTVEERFRRAAPDFTRPPHAGPLWYERFDWGVSGAEFRRLAADAIRVCTPSWHGR